MRRRSPTEKVTVSYRLPVDLVKTLGKQAVEERVRACELAERLLRTGLETARMQGEVVSAK